MNRYIRLLVVIVVVVVVGAGGYWFYQTRFAPASASSSGSTFTQIVPVRQGSLSSTVSVVGELDAVQSETLAFTHINDTVKLAKLNVVAGNSVKAGQVLASIDPAPYQQALDQAKSTLQADTKTLSDLQAPPTALAIATDDLAIATAQYQLASAQTALDNLVHPDMAQLQSNVADAQSALAKAQADLVAQQNDTASASQLNTLYQAEATPTADYNRLAAETYSDEYYQDRLRVAYNKMMDAQDARVTFQIQQQSALLSAQTTVRDAQQTLADAQTALDTAQAGGSALDAAKAKLDVQTAQVALATAQDNRTKLDEGADAATLATAQANVDRDELAVSDAQAVLDGTQLVASFDGTVLQTNVNVGDQVTSSTTVLTVANLKGLQVVASIDETTIKRVAAGQSVQITFDAFPGQTFQGKVLSIPLQGSLQNDVMVYEVPVSLAGAEQLALLVGMTANVKVQVGEARNALLVPSMALQKVNGLYEVLVADSSDPAAAPESVPVEVGLSDGTYTQITKGLNEGDRVVVEMQATTGQSNNSRGGGFGGAIQIAPVNRNNGR